MKNHSSIFNRPRPYLNYERTGELMRITIKNDLVSAVIDSKGAELKSYADQEGKDYLWCGDAKYWGGTSPVLFPMVGNLRDGKTEINGVEYVISKHGFARDYEFQVIEQSLDRVVFSFSYTEDTLKIFPFRFNLRLTYSLHGTALTLAYDVANLDEQDMYYHLGGHPAFNCPLEQNESFSDYILKFEKQENCMSPVYDLKNLQVSNENRICLLDNTDTLPLDYSLFNEDAVIFDDMRSRKVSLTNPATGKGISVDFNTFDMIAFWTPTGKEAPFLCIEPWNGAAIYSDEDNQFNHKRCIQTARPGESQNFRLIFDIL